MTDATLRRDLLSSDDRHTLDTAWHDAPIHGRTDTEDGTRGPGAQPGALTRSGAHHRRSTRGRTRTPTGAHDEKILPAAAPACAVDFDDQAPRWPPVDDARLEAEDAARVDEDLADRADARRADEVRGAR